MNQPSYHVICLDVPSDGVELIEAILYANSCLGLEEGEADISRIKLKTYFEVHEPLSQFVQKIITLLPQAENVNGTTISLSDIRFQAQTFEPLELVPGIWIVPPNDMPTDMKVESGRKIVIRPGAAFGTGRHESTQLAAGMIGEVLTRSNPTSLLDIGTGSGILAIHARKLDIECVESVEIDPLACINARENFELNGIGDICLYSDLAEVNRHYDVVVANILTPTIIFLKEKMLSLLNPGGFLIFSGITDSEGTQIEKAFGDLLLLKKEKKNEWLAYCFCMPRG